MPDLRMLLRDVLKKFPEINPVTVGIQYNDVKDGVPYMFTEGPLEGELLDDKGRRCEYLIGINKEMKHEDSLVKVGAIAGGLSSLYRHRKQTIEVGVGTQILQTIFGYNKLTGYNDWSLEDDRNESEKRGLGCAMDALNNYMKGG